MKKTDEELNALARQYTGIDGVKDLVFNIAYRLCEQEKDAEIAVLQGDMAVLNGRIAGHGEIMARQQHEIERLNADNARMASALNGTINGAFSSATHNALEQVVSELRSEKEALQAKYDELLEAFRLNVDNIEMHIIHIEQLRSENIELRSDVERLKDDVIGYKEELGRQISENEALEAKMKGMVEGLKGLKSTYANEYFGYVVYEADIQSLIAKGGKP